MGKIYYPDATEWLLTADGGGSNGCRSRDVEDRPSQGLSDATALQISASLFPPGTSQWNRIGHSRFCHITQNWRGRSLVSREVVLSLIAATTTAKGLIVNAALDLGLPTGMKMSDEDLASVSLERKVFTPEKTKNGDAPVMPIPDAMIPWYTKMAEISDGTIGFIYSGLVEGKPRTHEDTSPYVKRALKLAGLSARITNHRLGASFANISNKKGGASSRKGCWRQPLAFQNDVAITPS